ncbi:uncharacterized protein LOC111187229 isoform X2 [Delphinapterus leucas]|uniref:Uncharacterized protein LOC111187229 isoform X2 n=1 Tax=Delphinapterus leucas TaxID=9749 RepID=A0A2Y9QG13_DELLE|nr:uncharacterized protein LOC111187229 isoform X2 [Delphinapterus leucas]
MPVWSSALALPASVQTFLLLQVSLAEAGPHCARPGRPLARPGGGGARASSSARRGSSAGRREGLRAARIPPRLGGRLPAAFPPSNEVGEGVLETWSSRLRQVVRRSSGPREPWGSPSALLCTLLGTLKSASSGASSETGISSSSLPPAPSGLFLAPTSRGSQHLGAGKGGQRLRTLLWNARDTRRSQWRKVTREPGSAAAFPVTQRHQVEAKEAETKKTKERSKCSSRKQVVLFCGSGNRSVFHWENTELATSLVWSPL